MTTTQQPFPPSPPGTAASLDGRVSDISNSAAFTFLDSLLKAGKLSQAQVDFYKKKYARLHDVLIATYQNEKALLDKAKELKGGLESEKQRLEQKTLESHGMQQEIEQLQRESKEYVGRISLATDERNGVAFEYDELVATKREQREALQEKYNKSLTALDPLVASLHAKIDELKQEIEKQTELYNKEQAAANEYAQRIEAAQKQIGVLEKEKLKKRSQVSTAQGEPDRLKTNISLIESVAHDLNDECMKLAEEMSAREVELSRHQDARRATNSAIEELGVKLENYRVAISKRRGNLEEFRRAYEMEQQRREVTLERLRNSEATRRETKEAARSHLASANEYHKHLEAAKKSYEKLRRKRDTVTSIKQPLQEQIDVAARTLEEMQHQYRQQKRMLDEIKQDEELFIAQYLNQEKVDEDTSDALYQVQEEQKEYEDKILVLEREEKQLQHSITSLAAQRELMAREASKASQQFRTAKEELKVKNLILMDLDKATLESFEKLKSCATKYEKMKNQRNKLANLTASSAQALAEMKEKLKILTNEVDILRAESLAKDKAASEETRLHLAAQNTRDALRVQQNKYVNDLRMKRENEAQNQMEIIKLNNIITAAEQQMMSLRKDYAHAVDNRNLTGIQLIDRNDELCILYEKHNIQSTIIQNGDAQLQRLEDEIAARRRDIAEIKRRIEVSRKKIPSLDQYAQTIKQLKNLEEQLEREKQIAQEMCDKLESPSTNTVTGAASTSTTNKSSSDGESKESMDSTTSPTAAAGTGGVSSSSSSSGTALGGTRSRILKGMDPEPEQLAAKIEVLEERLNSKKEHLLEKELVLDEVSSLSDKLRTVASESRESTLDLAKRVNDVRARIRKTTRKMMAAVAELSMYQASAMRLEQEKTHLEQVLAEAKERMAHDQPPTDDAEAEWVRMERDRIRRAEAVMAGRAQQMENQDESTYLTPSTAEARPNAYIPEELGIPKPYGAIAPFKPTALGANARHIRPPKTLEIQL